MKRPLLLLLLAPALAAQAPVAVYELPGVRIREVVAVPDLDGDGTDDVVLRNSASPADRRLTILSGEDGTLLRTLPPPSGQTFAGAIYDSVVSAPDLDGDGVQDLAVLTESGAGSERVPAVALLSAATGTTIRVLPHPRPQRAGDFSIRARVAVVADLDGDGTDDVALSDYLEDSGIPDPNNSFDPLRTGSVYVFSSVSGALLITIENPRPPTAGEGVGYEFGSALLRTPDLDGDGVDDLLVGSTDVFRGEVEDDPRTSLGRVYLFALTPGEGGASATPIREVENPFPAADVADFGFSSALGPDGDGDGLADLFVSGNFFARDLANNQEGGVALISSATGALLRTVAAPAVTGFRERELRWFGEQLVPVPDLDGDGVADLLSGYADEANGFEDEVGRAYVISGATGRPAASLQAPAPANGDYFGVSMAAVRQNGGGAQVWVADYRGRVHVFSGSVAEAAPSGGASPPRLTVRAPTPPPEPILAARFGRRLAAVPDVDGDGVAEVAVAERAGIAPGRTHLVSGATGAVLRTLPPDAGLYDDGQNTYVFDLAGLPDLDDDGAGDVVASGGRGAAVFSGATGARLGSVSAEGQGSGLALAGLADVTGDGRGDVAVGSPDEGVGTSPNRQFGAGVVSISPGSGGSPRRQFESPEPVADGHFGAAAAAVPDLDGDGADELLVGAPAEGDGRSGRAYLLSGASGTLLRTLDAPSPTADAWFGHAVSAVPDADADGAPDLLVGACNETVEGRPGAGRAYLFSGATGALLRTFESPRPQAGGGFGCAVAGEDVDGDGTGDAVVGAPREDAGGARQAGRVYAFAGDSGAVLETWRSRDPQAVGAFGIAVVALGDTDGDGRGDVAIGAPGEHGTAGAVYITGRVSTASERASGGGLALSAWPNPARGRLSVAVRAGASQARLALYDVLGREVLSARVAPGSAAHVVPLDVSGLPAGVYLVRLRAGDRSLTRRLTVAR